MKYNGFRNLENSIGKIIKPIAKKKKDNFALLQNLQKNWQKIAGEKYYQYCQPVKVTINKQNKATLHIASFNSAVAFALQGHQNQIIEQIASYFGYKVIDSLRITQELRKIKAKNNIIEEKVNEKEAKIIHKNTKNIKDSELKDILEKLGKSVYSKKTD